VTPEGNGAGLMELRSAPVAVLAVGVVAKHQTLTCPHRKLDPRGVRRRVPRTRGRRPPDHGGEGRIRAGGFPARRTIEDFDFRFKRALKRDAVAHLGALDVIAECANIVLLGPLRTGKNHLAIGLGIRAWRAGQRVAFATPAERVNSSPTFECVRRHYDGDTTHPLADVLDRYQEFFNLFDNFTGNLSFWLLDALVDVDGSVRISLPSADFRPPPVLRSPAGYLAIRDRTIEFVPARNKRIYQLGVARSRRARGR